MNKARVYVGFGLIGMAITLYSLGYYKLVGEVGSGTVTVYPAAALVLVGGLSLWSEVRRLIAS